LKFENADRGLKNKFIVLIIIIFGALSSPFVQCAMMFVVELCALLEETERRAKRRLTDCRSQTMHDPSVLDVTHSVSARLARIHVTAALCSLSRKWRVTCRGPRDPSSPTSGTCTPASRVNKPEAKLTGITIIIIFYTPDSIITGVKTRS